MDVVMITRDRPELTAQCIQSMRENAADWSKHRLVVVFDGTADESLKFWKGNQGLCTGKQLGVGGAKNFGAEWISSNTEPPGLLMFSDNDMYYLPGWDRILEHGAERAGAVQVGGWRHPFHLFDPFNRIVQGRREAVNVHVGRQIYPNAGGSRTDTFAYEVDAVTGNCFVMRWSDWLKYGPFDSNATGPGQSEDYALSQRIRTGGGLVATLDPPVAIHCGLVNSSGEPATGWREMEDQITGQLATLSAEMRNSVLIMRPAPEPGDVQSIPMPTGRVIVAGNEPFRIYRDRGPQTEEPKPYYYKHLNQSLFRGTFEEARERLGMQPRDTAPCAEEHVQFDPRDIIRPGGPGGIREISIDEAMRMYPHPSRPALVGLNLCSGQRRFDSTKGWFNLDGQNIPPDRVPDLVWQANEPLPFSDASVMYVSIVHALEHFGCGESVPLLRECHRVLKPGGSLIVIVPDMKRLAARWLSGEISEYIFNVNCYGAYISDERDRHRWSMSRESLPALLREVGTWTRIAEFDYREIPGSDFPRDWWMLAMECVK